MNDDEIIRIVRSQIGLLRCVSLEGSGYNAQLAYGFPRLDSISSETISNGLRNKLQSLEIKLWSSFFALIN